MNIVKEYIPKVRKGVAFLGEMPHPVLLFLSALLFFFSATSCADRRRGDENRADRKRITVTFEPQRWIVEQIAGEDFDVNVLLPPGADPENYAPTVAQLRSLYDGGEWLSLNTMGVEKALLRSIADNSAGIRVGNMAEGIEPIEHSHREDDTGHDSAADKECHGHDFTDPHLWNSVRNMRIIAANTFKRLIALNPEREKLYRERYDSLDSRLQGYDEEIAESLRSKGTRAFLIRHPSLGYAARDYGLEQIALQAEEKEPSAMQMRYRIDRAKEMNAGVIVTENGKGDEASSLELAHQLGIHILSINTNSMQWPEEIMKLKDL